MKKSANRSEMVLVRLQPAERKLVADAAKTKGLGLSAFVRMVVLEHLNLEHLAADARARARLR